ncbi:MAG: hypothetical protein HY000_24190 [Planctomycetes bacterium]|nr:hypothetical protein [Planctomycetota bacterium]
MSKHQLPVPAEFPVLLEEIKARIRLAQTRAMQSVNAELVQVYWDIGRMIDGRQHPGKVPQAVAQMPDSLLWSVPTARLERGSRTPGSQTNALPLWASAAAGSSRPVEFPRAENRAAAAPCPRVQSCLCRESVHRSHGYGLTRDCTDTLSSLETMGKTHRVSS